MSWPQVDILAFAAHPDDIELSCAGTLLKHKAQGLKVGIIDLTQGEMGTRGSLEIRAEESKAASQLLQLDVRENLKIEDGFVFNTKENQLKVIAAIRKYRPRIVLANAITDRHTDHGKAALLVKEATFLSGLRKIEIIADGISLDAHRPKSIYHYIQDQYIEPDFVIDITEFMDQKMEVIKAFESQFFNPNSKEPETPISGSDFLEFIKARALQFGRGIGVKYAEGFTTVRTPGIDFLDDLI